MSSGMVGVSDGVHLPRRRAGTRADYEFMLRLHIRPHFGAAKVPGLGGAGDAPVQGLDIAASRASSSSPCGSPPASTIPTERNRHETQYNFHSQIAGSTASAKCDDNG